MIVAGSRVVLEVVGRTGGFLPIDADGLRSEAIQHLTPYADVLGMNIVHGSTLANILDFQWFHWNYTATVTLQTRLTHGSLDDIRRIVANAFYQASGAIMPTVTIPSRGEVSIPADTAAGPDFLPDLATALTSTTTLVLVALVGIVWIVATGPNVGAVARAVRP